MIWLMFGRTIIRLAGPFGMIPKGFFFVLIILQCSAVAMAEPAFRLTVSETLNILEKADLRIRMDGRYQGHLYKEARGFFHLDDSYEQYQGTIYVLEDFRNNNRQAKRITATYDAAVSLEGGFSGTAEAPLLYPRTRGFPALPEQLPDVGERWRDFGTQVIAPREGAKPTTIEFYCEYEYVGLSTYLEREVHAIKGQYATRYRRGQDPDGDESLTEASGKHLIAIFIDTRDGNWMFIRDQINEEFRFTDGQVLSQEGFYLTWYGGLYAVDRQAKAESVRELLEESGVKEVAVEPVAEGIALTIQNIHFVPDQAVILPEERRRLDQIADVLSTVGDQTIKAVGHTADVGTQESQFELSVQRAQVIIEEMVKRGIPATSFIYEGKGGTEPLATNENEEGRAQNRRVEFIILD